MRMHRLINVYLACAIFTVQGTGLHVHGHQHAGQHESGEAENIHLALATDHSGDQGRHHDQDVELSAPGNGIIKKAGADKDLLGSVLLRYSLPVFFVRSCQTLSTTCQSIQNQSSPFIRPPLRAPPVIHSV